MRNSVTEIKNVLPERRRAITRQAALSLRGRQESLHALARFFGEVNVRIVRIPLDLIGVLPCFPVNVQEILAKAPAKAAHAQVHPKPHARRKGELSIERFGNEFRNLFAIQHS
jgi:hypothetical protein